MPNEVPQNHEYLNFLIEVLRSLMQVTLLLLKHVSKW